MNKQVKDFTEGEHLEINLLISQILKGATNNGSPYLTLTIQDCTKSIDGKIWDVKPELEKQLEVGKVYCFTLDIIKYKNNLQAKITRVIPIPQFGLNMDEFVFKSPISKDDLQKNIMDGVNMIKNENIAKIVVAMLNYYDKNVFEYPAASKIHHNFIGGLATHVSGMLKIATAICDIYPIVNKDYLVAGVLLHDLGKIEELSSPVMTEYSIEGKLLGHISIGDARLLQIARELKLDNSEEVLILRHMILSHHGQLEYGSPMRPATLEAELLFMIDNIDARINILDKAFNDINEGEFTSKLFALENRTFYKHN